MDAIVRHGLKPLVVAVLVGLLVSFLPLLPNSGPSSRPSSPNHSNLDSPNISTPVDNDEEDNLWSENEEQIVAQEERALEEESAGFGEDYSQGETPQATTPVPVPVPVLNFDASPTASPAPFNTDYTDWISTFFPHFRDEMSQKDKLLKLVGFGRQSCEVPAGALDYTAGWQSRSMAYLFHSNKSRARCQPHPHAAQPSLQVVGRNEIYEHLNWSLGRRLCTVVFFFSGTCPFSRRAAPLMHSAAVYFPTLKFFAVNTDQLPGIAGHYGIMGVPVVILFSEKKFVTGWTIPYPDPRDTIRAFLMAHTDAKYIKTQKISFGEDSILSEFHLRKEADIFYTTSYLIILAALIRLLWHRVLVDMIQRCLDRSGLDSTRFALTPQQAQAGPPYQAGAVGGAAVDLDPVN